MFTRTPTFDEKAPLTLSGYLLDDSMLSVEADPGERLLSMNVQQTLATNKHQELGLQFYSQTPAPPTTGPNLTKNLRRHQPCRC